MPVSGRRRVVLAVLPCDRWYKLAYKLLFVVLSIRLRNYMFSIKEEIEMHKIFAERLSSDDEDGEGVKYGICS